MSNIRIKIRKTEFYILLYEYSFPEILFTKLINNIIHPNSKIKRKTRGKDIIALSKRSRKPPWPVIPNPNPLTPMLLLSIDSTRSPQVPAKETIAAITSRALL
jgi:hypothetical protein